LNDSRPLPMDVRRPAAPTRRLGEKVFLPLTRYGLEPGDEIKLFARVEDNDPAGAKGTESTVVTVRIISQEEFERMVRVRQGLQVLMSKYNQARRRLESVAGEMDGLRKQRKQQLKPGESAAKAALGDQQRRELKRLTRRLREEAEAIRKAGEHMLPYDLDANLADQLAQAAKSLEAMAKDLDDLQSAESPTQQDLDKLLEKLARQLAGDRRAFDERASQPLEHLAKIFPLIADQQRFLIIAARQRDLAERLASVKGHDTVTDPATKARLRDLEAEQHRLRDDLQALLTDIENHARSLPEDLKLEELRVSALRFVKAVRDSGAEAAMADAESALTEFAGTRGHAKAHQAAEILARFIGQCEGVGGQAGACLVFQPGLARGLGNTVAQLLAEMGMGSGSGGAGGGTSGGGYSARRGPGVGLYGSMPTLGGGDMAGGGFSDQNADQGARGNATASPGGDPRTVADVQAASEAGGTSQLVVPPRYRQRVGQYFQRVADEVGDSR